MTPAESRELLLDAAHEMIASYQDEGRDLPIGGGHAEQVTIEIAAARGGAIASVIASSTAARNREGRSR